MQLVFALTIVSLILFLVNLKPVISMFWQVVKGDQIMQSTTQTILTFDELCHRANSLEIISDSKINMMINRVPYLIYAELNEDNLGSLYMKEGNEAPVLLQNNLYYNKQSDEIAIEFIGLNDILKTDPLMTNPSVLKVQFFYKDHQGQLIKFEQMYPLGSEHETVLPVY